MKENPFGDKDIGESLASVGIFTRDKFIPAVNRISVSVFRIEQQFLFYSNNVE